MRKRIKQIFQKLRDRAASVHIPALDPIKASVLFWWNVTRRSVNLWLECNAFSYAGSLAFYTLFSLAPTVIIAVTMIGLIFGQDAAQGEIVAQLQDIMGTEAATAVEQAVRQSRIEESGILPTLLGVGTLLIGATTVFAQMQFSLNVIWGVTAKPSQNSILLFIKNRMLSLTVVLAIGFVLIVSLLFGVVLRAALTRAEDMVPAFGTLLGGMELGVMMALIAVLFATIFKVLPDVVLGWKDVLIGAVVTAVLFAIGRNAIATYLAYTATASTYGAAGSVVLILLWVYYSSLILLFGAAFTREYVAAQNRTVMPRNSAVFVKRELIDREMLNKAASATQQPKGEQDA